MTNSTLYMKCLEVHFRETKDEALIKFDRTSFYIALGEQRSDGMEAHTTKPSLKLKTSNFRDNLPDSTGDKLLVDNILLQVLLYAEAYARPRYDKK